MLRGVKFIEVILEDLDERIRQVSLIFMEVLLDRPVDIVKHKPF